MRLRGGTISQRTLLRTEAPRPRVVCYGAACIDLITAVASFPEPDAKIRAQRWLFEGGGNAGNVAIALSRLGVTTRILTKLGADWFGEQALAVLAADNVDCTEVVVKPGILSPFTYVIVDNEAKTRTCIHHALSEDMTVDEVSSQWLDGVEAAYFDCRLPVGAVKLAEICIERLVPVFLDAEKPRPGLVELLTRTTYLHTNNSFPLLHTNHTDLLHAIPQILRDLKNVRFVTTTLGAKGALLVTRCHEKGTPVSTLSEVMKRSEACVQFEGQFFLFRHAPGAALSPGEVVDTTGCGDAFTAAIIFWLSRDGWLLKEFDGTTLKYKTADANAAICEPLRRSEDPCAWSAAWIASHR